MFKLWFCSQTAILKYNPKYRGQWSFDALTAFVEVHVSFQTDSKQITDSWEWIKKSNGRTDSFQFGRNEELDTSALFQKMAALALKLPDYVMKVHKPAGSTGL